MTSEYEITRKFKIANANLPLSPGYLYEIGLICTTPNWLSQTNRHNLPLAKIRIEKRR